MSITPPMPGTVMFYRLCRHSELSQHLITTLDSVALDAREKGRITVRAERLASTLRKVISDKIRHES